MVRSARPVPPERGPDWQYADPDLPRDGGYCPPSTEERHSISIRRKLDRANERLLDIRSAIMVGSAFVAGAICALALLILIAMIR